jgi:two-component system chemotaxis response regulator CheY
MRILIVEDDCTSRDLLESFLSPCGECQIAVNGREAVAAFSAAQKDGCAYDLICMDIMMPEMDGHAAVKEIRALEEAAGTSCSQRVKIMMTTALDDVGNVTQSLVGTCDAYLIKPIDRAKLLDHIKALRLL